MTKIEKVIKNQQIFRTKDNKTRQKKSKNNKTTEGKRKKTGFIILLVSCHSL